METMTVKPQLSEQAKAWLAERAVKVPTKDTITDSNVTLSHDSKNNRLVLTIDLNSASMRGDKVNISERKPARDAKTGQLLTDKDGVQKMSGGNLMLAALYGPLSRILGHKVKLGILGEEFRDATITLSMTVKE